MPEDEYEAVGSDPVFRIVRSIVPWVVLGLVVWALVGMWGSFQRSKQSVDATLGSAEPTVTAPASAGASSAVTGMVAVTRIDVQIRALPDTASEVLTTSRKGSTLTILSKQGTYFRVKDGAGHIGWIPNDVKYVDVRTAKPAKKK